MKTLATLSLTAVVLAALPVASLSPPTMTIVRRASRSLKPAARSSRLRALPPSNGVPRQISKLTPGNVHRCVQDQLPGALFVEQREDAGRKLDATASSSTSLTTSRRKVISTAADEAWFYFKDGQL